MSARLIVQPIVLWTLPEEEPQAPPFRASRASTLALLRTQVAALGADHAVVELDIDPSQIRLDGELRAGTRPRTRRVRVTCVSPDSGPLSFACAHWGGARGVPDWVANLRAIGLTIQALRAAARYGVGSGHEQYVGFRALEAR